MVTLLTLIIAVLIPAIGPAAAGLTPRWPNATEVEEIVEREKHAAPKKLLPHSHFLIDARPAA
jgi:hypothetical protein